MSSQHTDSFLACVRFVPFLHTVHFLCPNVHCSDETFVSQSYILSSTFFWNMIHGRVRNRRNTALLFLEILLDVVCNNPADLDP
jgi:hypothetical protein